MIWCNTVQRLMVGWLIVLLFAMWGACAFLLAEVRDLQKEVAEHREMLDVAHGSILTLLRANETQIRLHERNLKMIADISPPRKSKGHGPAPKRTLPAAGGPKATAQK